MSFKYFFRDYKDFETSGTILNGCHQLQWHLSRQHLTRQNLSLLAISQLLLNQFEPTINSSFQRPSLPDAICQGDICQGNIRPGGICTCQQYISSAPDLIFIKLFGPTFLGGKNCFRPKFCYIQTFIIPKVFGPIFFWTYIFLDQIFCNPKLFLDQKFSLCPNLFLSQIFFWLKFFLDL